MKKLTIIIATLALMAATYSCKTIDDCPAYSTTETITDLNATA